MKLSQKQINSIAQTLDMGMVCYIHKKTGVVKELPNEEMMMYGDTELWEKDVEAIESDIFSYVKIEPMRSGESYPIMEDFADQVRNRRLQKSLMQALNGRRPFANFKNVIDHSDSRDDWFKFKQKKYEAWVRREIRGDFEFELEDTDEGTAVSETGLTEAKMNEIIMMEIIVDAKDEDEVIMGWFHYMADELEFPFEAEIESKNRRGETSVIQIDVLDLSDRNQNPTSPEVILEVSEKESERVIDIGVSKLQNVKGSEATQDAVAIWKHWDSGKFKFG